MCLLLISPLNKRTIESGFVEKKFFLTFFFGDKNNVSMEFRFTFLMDCFFFFLTQLTFNYCIC